MGDYAQSMDLLRRALAESMAMQPKARLRANLGVVQWQAGARKAQAGNAK